MRVRVRVRVRMRVRVRVGVRVRVRVRELLTFTATRRNDLATLLRTLKVYSPRCRQPAVERVVHS